METTTSTVDIATAANYEATAVVEELLKRDQGMFDSAEILAALDLVDTATAGRTKATSQPLLDASGTKGGLLLDLWAGLEALR